MFWMLLRITIMVYVGFALLLFGMQRKMIFPSSRTMDRDPGIYNWEFEEVTLAVGKETTFGWFIPLEKARGVALFSHGNAGNLADRLESIGLLRELGFSVLAYDYGGYGNSTGKSSEKRCYADARAMWGWLTNDKGVAPEEVVLFGRSLGGAVTIDLATKVNPAAVIAESTFLSTVDLGKEMFSWMPVGLFLTHRFSNKDKIDKIETPLLIIHSPDDTLIPYTHGRKLFELAKEPKTFLEIRGDHNEGFVLSKDVYARGWRKFLKPILPMPQK